MSDLRERVAEAMWMADPDTYDPADRRPFSEADWEARRNYLAEADAAIALVLEEAAKVALILEEERVGIPCPDGIKGCAVFHFRREQRPRTPLEIAAAIRALKEGK